MSEIVTLLDSGLLAETEGISQQARDLLADSPYTEIEFFDEDRFIIRQGEKPDALYFTLDGVFHAISHANPSAPNRLLGKIRPGEFIGEVSLVDPSATASASIRAIKGAIALRIKQASFAAFREEHPREASEFLLAVARQLGRRLREANERVL